MRLSLAATSAPDLLLPQALELTRATGFASIQLYRDRTQSSPVHPDLSVRNVRHHLEQSGVALSSLWVRNLTGRKADSDERNLAYNLRQISWDIHLARALGTRAVIMGGGPRNAEARKDLIAGVNQLLENIPDVEINLVSQASTPLQGLADFTDLVPELGSTARFLLDTRSLLAAGEDLVAFAETFKDRIGLVQLGDLLKAEPVPLGTGDLPLPELIERLQTTGYTRMLVVDEPPASPENAQAAIRAAREHIETML